MIRNLAEIREYWHDARDEEPLPQDYLSWDAARKQDFYGKRKFCNLNTTRFRLYKK